VIRQPATLGSEVPRWVVIAEAGEQGRLIEQSGRRDAPGPQRAAEQPRTASTDSRAEVAAARVRRA
jgi:hypothetical protein